ncbi:MAG: enoyl-CoA hydratase [Acidobacteriota bacterium]
MLDRIDHPADIRELRLARPPANALDPDLVATLTEAIVAAPRDGARALVVSARPRMYSGGLDVPVLLALERPAMERFLGDFLSLLRAIATSPVPIVAAITGHAPAGGAVLAIHCDYRVMVAGDFRIGLNEVAVGLPLPRVIHSTLVRLVGPAAAEKLAVAGALIPAAEALRLGLVDELVEPDAVVERAVAKAGELVALPARAMAATRELARRDLVESFAREERATWEAFVEDWFSAETQAALRALVERLSKKG